MAPTKKKAGPDAGEAAEELKLIALAKSIRARSAKGSSDGQRRDTSDERQPEPEIDPHAHLRASEAVKKTKDGFALPTRSNSSSSENSDRDNEKNTNNNRSLKPRSMVSPAQALYGSSAPKKSSRHSSASSSPSSSSSSVDSLPLRYDPPYWSTLPEADFGFDVIKNGTVVANVPINSKPFLVVGRHPSCDLVLQHPSISRQHCIIQHREGNLVYLYELGSTHGTKVNKKNLAKCDHVQVHVGDVIKFGESSRLYVLTGPQELERVAPERVLPDHIRAKIAQTKQKKIEEKRKQQLAEQMALSNDMSWGMDDESKLDDDLSDDPLEGFKPKTDRQKKLWERIEAKESKIANIRVEMTTLMRKKSAQGELTEGQQHAMERCEKRVGQLEEIIESMKETLRDELDLAHRRKTGMSLKKRRKLRLKKQREAMREDSDDEFYDRTLVDKRPVRRKGGGNSSANAEEIDKVAVVRMSVREIESALMHMRLERRRLRKYLQGLEEEESKEGVDSLDAFMSTVSQGLKEESASKFKIQLGTIEKKIKHYESTLTFKKKSGGGTRGGTQEDHDPESTKPKRRFRRSDMPQPKSKGAEEKIEDFRMPKARLRPEVAEKADRSEDSEKELPKASMPSSAPASAAGSVSSALKRMGKMKKKMQHMIEEKRRQAYAEAEAAANATKAEDPANNGKKSNKKQKNKKKNRKGPFREGEVETEGGGGGDGDGKSEGAVVENEVPVKEDNESIRNKFKEIYEKMRRDEETQKNLFRLPANEQEEQQVGLIVRKKKRKAGENQGSNAMTEMVAQRAKVPRRSHIGPAVTKPSTIVEDEAEWQDTAWRPPAGQTGDGRTHLNDKYGY